MNINEFRIGNLARAGDTVGEVVDIDPSGYYFEVKNAAGASTEVDKLSIEPILLQRELLINTLGFDGNGRLLVNIDSRPFYFQEKDGHIILLEDNLMPLIHFWDLKTVHQLQNFYYRFTGKTLPYNLPDFDHRSITNPQMR